MLESFRRNLIAGFVISEQMMLSDWTGISAAEI